MKTNKFFNYIKNLFFPTNIKCLICGEELNHKSINSICEDCYPTLPFITNPCPKCGAQISINNTGVCINCKRNNAEFIKNVSVFNYDGEIAKLIQKFKFGGGKFALEPLSRFLAETYAKSNINADFVVSVPIFIKQEKLRGYNQAKILAKNFSNLTKIEFLDCIDKIKETTEQAKLNYADRKKNLVDAYKINKEFKEKLKDQTILIIDDVMTTGSTASEISKTLKRAGVKGCYVLTLAHSKFDFTDTPSQS